VYDANAKQATVKVAWWSPAEAPTSAKGEVRISGGNSQQAFPSYWRTGTSFVTVVDRMPGQDLRIVANIGGLADTAVVPHIPAISVTRTAREVIQPSDRVTRLANDGTGRSVGPISGCYEAAGNGVIRSGSGSIVWIVRAGPIDHTSYAKITNQTEERVCWEAYLRPLARDGGDLQFKVKYVVDNFAFSVR
jgi:hypothetical protein